MFDTSSRGISPMITIRTPKVISQPTLIGFEATLKTPHAVFEMSSNGLAVEINASVGACMVELRGPARCSGSATIWS